MSTPPLTDQEISAAEAALTQLIGASHIPDAKIHVHKGFTGFVKDMKHNEEVLTVSVESDAVASQPEAVMKNVIKKLETIPSLDDATQLENNAEYAKEVRTKLKALQQEGIPIPEHVFQWEGFNEKFSENAIADHALRFHISEKGISGSVSIPSRDDSDFSSMERAEQVANNFRQRLPQIKQMIAEQMQRFNPKMQAEDLQRIQQLEIAVDTFSNGNYTDVTINFSSPDQKQSIAKPGEKVENPEALLHSNPLSQLSNKHLGKALGKALLHSDEQALEILPLIAGRQDIKSAVKYAIREAKEKNPELCTKNAEKVLDEHLFHDQQNWNKRFDEREFQIHPPSIDAIDPDHPNRMIFRFRLPKGKADEVIQDLAKAELSEGIEKQSVSRETLINTTSQPEIFHKLAAMLREIEPNRGSTPSTLVKAVNDVKQCLCEQQTAL